MKIQGVARLAVCSVSIAFAAAAEAQWITWPIAEGGNGHSYLPVQSTNFISWSQAEQLARANGGYLVTITSAEEDAFVFSLINFPKYWNGEFGPLLGGYQPPGSQEPAGGWTWVSGESWQYTHWAGGQPDNGDPSGEAGLHYWGGFQWNDKRTNDVHFFGYVVERGICTPHKATATAQLVNGFVVGATLLDGGCGYTSPPVVLIQGGGGSGAMAMAMITNGEVTAIQIINAGCCYTNAPEIVIGSPPAPPTVSIAVSKVKVSQNVVLGGRYLLESSTNNADWAPIGAEFTADAETIVTEFDVDTAGRFFRLRVVP